MYCTAENGFTDERLGKMCEGKMSALMAEGSLKHYAHM